MLAIAILASTGCAQLPPEDIVPANAAKPASQPTGNVQDPAYALLQQAEAAPSPQRESLLLQAADYYQQKGDSSRLGRVLQEINPAALSDDPLMKYSLLYGSWAISQHQLAAAETALLNPRLPEKPDTASAVRLHALRAQLYEMEQKPLDALHERIVESTLLPESGQREVGEAIWRLFSQLRDEEFRILEFADTGNKSEEQLLAGWVALARVQRMGLNDIAVQVSALKDWQRSWPLHPANRFMPTDMAMLGKIESDQPQRIALLLPLTGKHAEAGRAVRDGFLTQYYRRLADRNDAVQVDLVDSNAAPDILTAYNGAVAKGAQLVIGPLEREQVQVLANQPGLPVPTLALNNPPIQNPGPEDMYQFSLNPEDDVVQLAETAAAARLRRAVIFAPQGERGERLVQAFTRRWEALGGTVSGKMRYQPDSDNYNLPVAEALGITLATGQLREGSTLPDLVFFAGNSKDAAAIIEALVGSGAGQLPVYATSQAFSASSQASGNLRVCLSPWQAGMGPLRVAGAKATNDADMLFAMGADANEIYPRLLLMQSNPSLNVPGNTGYLSMDGNRNIMRRLVWGVMQDGQLRVLPVMMGERYP